jgi:malonate transporter
MNYVQLILPDFLLILCGTLLCRYSALKKPVWEQVEILVYYFLFPVLLFHSIVKSPIELSSASHLMVAGWMTGLSAIALSYSLPYWPVLKNQFSAHDYAGSSQIAFRFNSFIGLALADRLGGAAGVQQMAVLVGVCVPMFNIAAVWPMARHSQRPFLKELARNPLIIATLSGLAVNFMGLSIPQWLEPSVGRIGAASLALGLMSAGAGLMIHSVAQVKVLTASVLTIRHLITPLVAFGVTQVLSLPPLQASVLLAFSALPTASSSYVLASRMGYNGSIVAGMVTLSTLLGIASLPFALGVLGSL